MKCPDHETLLRLCHGESVEGEEKIRSHIEQCDRCRSFMQEEGSLHKAIREFLTRAGRPEVREAIECPDAEEIASFAEGGASAYRKMQLLRHFCDCPGCARAALEAARGGKDTRANAPADLIREARAVYGGDDNSSPPPRS